MIGRPKIQIKEINLQATVFNINKITVVCFLGHLAGK